MAHKKICAWCSSEYVAPRSNSRFCQNKCYQAFFRENNPEKCRGYTQRYYHEGNGRNRSKKYAQNNAEHLREYKHHHYLANKDDYLARATKQAAEKPDTVRAYKRNYSKTPAGQQTSYNSTRRRLARKAAAEGSFTKAEFLDVCREFDCYCLRCEKQFPIGKLTADHVVPLDSGGSDYISNIQPLCMSCNGRKHVKTIDYRPNFRRHGVKKEPDR